MRDSKVAFSKELSPSPAHCSSAALSNSSDTGGDDDDGDDDGDDGDDDGSGGDDDDVLAVDEGGELEAKPLGASCPNAEE